jgi:signal transduction histidine kinase
MKKNLTFKNDIRNKLWLFSILPVLFLSLLFMGFIYFTLQDSYEKSHIRILKSFDYRLNYFFENTLKKIEYLKENDINEQEIKFTLRYNSEFESMMVLNEDGIIEKSFFKNSDTSFNGFDYSRNKIYKKFLKNNKKPFFSNINFSSLTNKRSISYIFEYKDNIYLINLNIKEISKHIQYLNNSFDGQIMVIDKNGKFIVNTRVENISNKSFYNTPLYNKLIKHHKQFEYIDYFDEELNRNNHLTFMINKNTQWTVILIDNYDKLNKILMDILVFLIIFTIILSIIIIIVASRVTQKIVNPIYDIINEMDKFSNNQHKNNLYLRDDIQYPMFKKIVKSFNKMQDKVISRENDLIALNKNLEEKVKEKTIQLEEINENLHKKVEHEIKLNTQKEKILFEQSKMAAMGEMIGNIAHQWRQPLSLISTVSSGLKFKYEMGIFDEKEYIASLDKIQKSTEYLSNTIDDFRNFFKKDKEIKEFDVEQLINKSITLMGNTFTSNNIQLIINIEKLLLRGYENELLQAILNIFNNAKDALLDKDDNKIIIVSTSIDKRNVEIKIQDSAGGIPANIIDKIYDPYFTTKHQSQGTGIGLFMTKEIISKHMHGDIKIENKKFIFEDNEYYGALFTISIPINLTEVVNTIKE